jgi:SAM-dependent methyltransferase
VLELGSGYGRLLEALAAPERELWGLELDKNLLALGRAAAARLPAARRRSIKLVQGDMERFQLGRKFERVILPYNALYCLLSPARVERCFRAVRAALEPGGIFAFDVWNADRLSKGELAGDAIEELKSIELEGRAWSVFEQCRAGQGLHQLDVTYTYVPARGAARSQVVRQRYYRSSELVGMLERAGLRVRSKHGNFARGRFREQAARLVLTAEVTTSGAYLA